MTVAIDRREKFDPADFLRHHLAPRTPVVVTDAAADWSLWRSADELRAELGHHLVQIYNDLFDLTGVTPLQSYLQDYFGRQQQSAAGAALPYVRWYTQLKEVDFVWADEAFAGFADRWHMPYFLPPADYLLPGTAPARAVSPARDPFPGRGLFISCRGASTRRHHDPWASDAILCQILGHKQISFYGPVKQSAGEKLDLESNPPSAAQLELAPGEVLYIPRGTLHSALSLTDSVSLTWNFVHRSTWPDFFQHLASPAATSEMPVLRYFARLAGSQTLP